MKTAGKNTDDKPSMSFGAPSTPTTPRLLIQRRHPSEFKVCPVCQTLNVKENKSCCCCSWHGKFDHDSHTVQLGMWQLVNGSDELQILLLKELRVSPWAKFTYKLRMLFRRRIDLRA